MLLQVGELLKSKNLTQKTSLSLSLSPRKPLQNLCGSHSRVCFRKNAIYRHDWSHRKKGEIRYVETTNYQVVLYCGSAVL